MKSLSFRLLMQTSSKDTPFSGNYSFFIKNFPFSKKIFREQIKIFPFFISRAEEGKKQGVKDFFEFILFKQPFFCRKAKKSAYFCSLKRRNHAVSVEK